MRANEGTIKFHNEVKSERKAKSKKDIDLGY